MSGPVDRFNGQATPDSPPDRWARITPSDSEYLAALPKGLYIGHDGATGPSEAVLALECYDGNVEPFRVRPGMFLWLRPVRVRATGTTPGLVVVGLY